MINIIVAVDKNYGIGYDNKLPWKIPEEIKLFKEKTMNAICIVGNKTYDSLPASLFEDRMIFAVSNKLGISLEKVLKGAKLKYPEKDVFICGGAILYSYVLQKYKDKVKIHISFIKNEYECDTFFNKDLLKDFYITSKKSNIDDTFDHCEMIYKKYGEYQYLNLIHDVLYNGENRIGRNGEIISDFSKHLKFDLRDGFPLLTTKKMFIKGIIEELLFFIRGDTDTKKLEEKGINIWKGNTSKEFLEKNNLDYKEGIMGPMYGYQWRFFNSPYDLSPHPKMNVDQLKYVINEIKNNPTSRRILLTTFNPSQVNDGVLYPCHSIIIQFYVQEDFLDMFCFNRSSDLFLGLPFNIASTALFLMIIAKLTNLVPRYFNLSLGDVHIYSSHVDGVKEQLRRKPYIFPKIILPEYIKCLEDVEKLKFTDFILDEYNSYPSIKMNMIV